VAHTFLGIIHIHVPWHREVVGPGLLESFGTGVESAWGPTAQKAAAASVVAAWALSAGLMWVLHLLQSSFLAAGFY